MSSWVGNPGRPPYVIPRGSAGLKKKEHRHKVQGRDGRDGRRDVQREHAFIEEVRQAAREQKGQVVPDWVEETEPEQEPTPTEAQYFRRGG